MVRLVYISLSGDGSTVAIGAPYNDSVNGADSGHVRVFSHLFSYVPGSCCSKFVKDINVMSMHNNNDTGNTSYFLNTSLMDHLNKRTKRIIVLMFINH